MAELQFEARLRSALREAAEREMERGRAARTVATGRSALVVTRRWLPAVAVVAATLIALAVAAIVLTFGHPEREAVRPPEIVGRLTLADSLGGAVGVSGSVWLDDRGGNRLLRVDPSGRRVIARIPVPEDVAMAPVGGTLWALPSTHPSGPNDFRSSLLRVDARASRVEARIPLRTPSGEPFAGLAMAADPDSVWILGSTARWVDRDTLGVLRVDPRTGRVTRAVALPGGWGPAGIAVRGSGMWAITADQRLLRFDALTGARLSERRLSLPQGDRNSDPVHGSLGFAGNALITVAPGGLARVDPQSARVIWRRPLGQGVQTWTSAGGLIWAVARTSTGDRLFAVRPRTGRIATSVGLAAFGAAGIAAIDDQLWIATAGGQAVVLRR